MFGKKVSGYLDVKISSKSRRGLTPWKAWQRQWCEIRRLDSIENGIELKLKTAIDGNVLSCVIIPRSSTICRMESRTKLYAFGVFTSGRNHKPLLFLSGNSETDTQSWMSTIRQMLCVATYLPVGDTNFHVSLIDNKHSRAAGLLGTHGVLGVNAQEITISDPCTGDQKLSWPWFHFHQFHLHASSQDEDNRMIIVMHTSGEFPAGPGQLYMYCTESDHLLNHLVSRGKLNMHNYGLKAYKRLSQSESDLCANCAPNNSPTCLRSQAGSDDSGVRVSISSDDSVFVAQTKSDDFCMNVLTKTPGGSETNDDSLQDLTMIDDSPTRCPLARNESGISLASGIYEEISEDTTKDCSTKRLTNHIYENPIDCLLDGKCKVGKLLTPPPLPPRQYDGFDSTDEAITFSPKARSNTLPAKDLSRISQIFTVESDYVVMSPSKKTEKTKEKSKISAIAESLYLPMSPVINLKNRIDNYYMSMNNVRK